MKKLGVFIIFCILLLSLVIAANNSPRVKNQIGNGNNENGSNAGENQGLGNVIRNRVKAGVYTSESGKQIRVSEMARDRVRLKVNNVSVECACNLTRERDKNKSQFKMKLSNGRNARVKIMPDKASEKALERLRVRNCNKGNNCSIELKEVGRENKTAAYEIQLERHSRILGIFKKKMRVKSQVSAESGEIVRVKKPWWAFLASEPEE
jgi:hypothetical protein